LNVHAYGVWPIQNKTLRVHSGILTQVFCQDIVGHVRSLRARMLEVEKKKMKKLRELTEED